MNKKDKFPIYIQKAVCYYYLSVFLKNRNQSRHIFYYNKHQRYLKKAQKMGEESIRSEFGKIQPANIRFLHAAPDFPFVDIYVNGFLLFENFPYKAISSYLTLPDKSRLVEVYLSGSKKQLIIQEILPKINDQSLTFSITGTRKKIKLLKYVGQIGTPTKIPTFRVIHLSPDAPSIDIGNKKGETIFESIDFTVSKTNLNVSPLPMELEVYVADSKNPLLSFQITKDMGDKSFTLALVGYITEDPGLEAIFFYD